MPRRGAPISDTLHPYDGAEPYLFVSYARKDRELVIPIAQELVRAGVRLWWDEGLHAGEDFGERIEQRVKGCVGILVFLSKHSTTKKAQNWVLEETKLAANAGKDVIPIRCDDCDPTLEWKTLVAHRQAVELRGGDSERVIAEVVRRASILSAWTPPMADPVRAPRPKQLSSVPDLTKGGTEQSGTLPAWASKSLKLIARIGSFGPWGFDDRDSVLVDTLPEDDEFRLDLPLTVDTQKDHKKCGEILSEARTLDDHTVPFPARLKTALKLIRRKPDGTSFESERALYCVHLINLISVIRLYSEVHEAPDVEVTRAIESAINYGEEIRQYPDSTSAALELLLQVTASALELELLLACDPPSAQEIKKAASIGHLAYGDVWRARIRAAANLDRRIFRFSYAKKASPKYVEDSDSVLAEFTRIWRYAWWMCRTADFLRFPSNLKISDENRSPPSYYSQLPFPGDISAGFLEARGSWRFIEVCDLSRFNHEFENYSLAASLLTTSLSGLGGIAARQGSWHTPPIAANPRKLLACLALANSRFHLNSPGDSAALVHAALQVAAEPTEPRSDYITASARCLRHCISRHPEGRRYWHPAESIQTDSVRSVLWSHMIHLLATDDTSAGDAVFVAHMTDPAHGGFRAGIELHSRLHSADATGAALAKALERLRAEAGLRLRVRSKYYFVPDEIAESVASRVSEALAR
jgi:TIR domain